MLFCPDRGVFWDLEAQEPYSSEGRRYHSGRVFLDMGAQDPHSTGVGQCPSRRAWALRNHTALRGGLLSRGVLTPRGGSAPLIFTDSFLLGFFQ